jgi:hypothetical protein
MPELNHVSYVWEPGRPLSLSYSVTKMPEHTLPNVAHRVVKPPMPNDPTGRFLHGINGTHIRLSTGNESPCKTTHMRLCESKVQDHSDDSDLRCDSATNNHTIFILTETLASTPWPSRASWHAMWGAQRMRGVCARAPRA